MDEITRYSDAGISPRTEVFAVRRMLKAAMPVLILEMFGLVEPMPRNKSENIVFRRPRTFEAADTPLVEGVTPEADTFDFEDVRSTLKEYGQVVKTSNRVTDLHEDPVLMKISEQLGKNIGRTLEKIRWGVLRAGTNVFYSNGTARSMVNTKLTLSLQRRIVQALDAQHAMPITSVLSGSVNIGTRPVEASFVAVTHTNMQSDIRSLPGFVPVAEYGTMKPLHVRELGSVENTRYLTSPDLPPFLSAGGAPGSTVLSANGTNADVYPVLYFGEDAFGCVPLRGKEAVRPTIIPASRKDKSDPLGQRAIVGWLTYFTCLILNQAWMARAECGASDLAQVSVGA